MYHNDTQFGLYGASMPFPCSLPPRRVRAPKATAPFDPQKFLATAGIGRTVQQHQAKQVIFSQGKLADSVFYVQRGTVRLSVVSKGGGLHLGDRLIRGFVETQKNGWESEEREKKNSSNCRSMKVRFLAVRHGKTK
jgi:CRP-like cAMP-binding protein